jgi:hypothetical protein
LVNQKGKKTMGRNGARVERAGERGTVGCRQRQRQRQWRRMRPTIVALEDRRLLSTFVVNNATDTPVAGETDLRQAITSANATTGANTITFDSTVFATPQTITLGGTQLELSNTTGTQMITGPAAGVTVSGGGLSRVFQVESGVTASISGISITGGGGEVGGGGLLVSSGGTATLFDCTVSGNHANYGGGLLTYGTTTLNDCAVSGNSANGAGGVWVDGGTATLTNVTVSNNSAAGFGGGLNIESGTATLFDCTISGNAAGSGRPWHGR